MEKLDDAFEGGQKPASSSLTSFMLTFACVNGFGDWPGPNAVAADDGHDHAGHSHAGHDHAGHEHSERHAIQVRASPNAGRRTIESCHGDVADEHPKGRRERDCRSLV